MCDRVYLLLDVVDGESQPVARAIRGMPGVVAVDCLEERPDVLAVMEAPDRMKLAQAMMSVIGQVDSSLEDLRIMVARGEVSSVAGPRRASLNR